MLDAAFLRYLVVGALNTGLGFGLILLLQFGAGLAPLTANACGYLLGWGVGYALNRRWTFRSQRDHLTGLPAYALAALGCYALNALVLAFSLSSWGLPPLAAQCLAMAAYTVSFYLVNRYVIFDSRRE